MMDQHLIPVWETITASWKKVKGSKASFWAALIIMLLVAIAFGIINFVTKPIPIIYPLMKIIGEIVNFLLHMGILYMGIKRAFGEPINYRMMFRTFESQVGIRVIGLYILQIIIFIPFILILIIPAAILEYALPAELSRRLLIAFFYLIGIVSIIYVGVRMSLSMAYVVDKISNPWESIKLSFAATKSNFWRLLGIFILEIIIFVLSLIPLGIALIWTIPLFYIIYGKMYERLSVNAAK